MLELRDSLTNEILVRAVDRRGRNPSHMPRQADSVRTWSEVRQVARGSVRMVRQRLEELDQAWAAGSGLRPSRKRWRALSTVGEMLCVLPGVLDDQAEQRQSLLFLVDNFPRQDVEFRLQASRTAVHVQHVREQHKIHRADRTAVVDAHIE